MTNTNRKSSNWMISNPLELEVARGNVVGYSELHCIAERISIQANVEGNDVWQGTAFIIPIPNQLGGEKLCVTSSSYDDRVNGTGANISVGYEGYLIDNESKGGHMEDWFGIAFEFTL